MMSKDSTRIFDPQQNACLSFDRLHVERASVFLAEPPLTISHRIPPFTLPRETP